MIDSVKKFMQINFKVEVIRSSMKKLIIGGLLLWKSSKKNIDTIC